MCTAIKAAAFALLSFAHTSAFVIPESTAPPANPIIEYVPDDALVKFDINPVGATEQYPTFTFQVEETGKACGESNILLNGLKLDSKWEGVTAHGRDYLDLYGGKEAEWDITCLFDSVPADGSNSDGRDVKHFLNLRIGSPTDIIRSGFSVSYKQMDRPAILRLKAGYSSFDPQRHPRLAKLWRIPSLEFDPEVLEMESAQRNTLTSSYGHVGSRQKSLGTYLHDIEGSLKKGFKEIVDKFCPTHRAQGQQSQKPAAVNHQSDRRPVIDSTAHDELDLPSTSPDKTLTVSETSKTTNTLSHLPAAETRSLASSETSLPSATPVSASFSDPEIRYDTHLVKVFGLVLIVVVCISWICLRCRDPRRRADCLARREERRNKKLYRKAARDHKIKMWFWNFRVRYGLAPREDLSWDEKRTRVLQQETILEDAMTETIRSFRNTHRIESLITAAEEGQNVFVYDPEGSERRRSISTLPGYESEGSQPPTYDAVGGGLDGVAVANGFRYIPAETEFRSDSSVISTSPRISRDGTNSEFDEKIEPISLGSTAPAG